MANMAKESLAAPSLLVFPGATATPNANPETPSPTLQPVLSPLTFSPSNPPPTPPRLASSSPDTMTPDLPFNLLDEMRQQQQSQLAGSREKVALYQFPAYLSTNVRRVLARGKHGRSDWALALSCLLWRGLLRYTSLPAAQDLSAALLDLDTDDGLTTLAGEQIEQWRKGFRFTISDPTHTMGFEKTRSWKAPDFVHSELFDLASRLGMLGSTLGTVAVMAALQDQDGVLGDHGDHMRATVAQLDGLLAERGRRLQGLVRAIRAGVWR